MSPAYVEPPSSQRQSVSKSKASEKRVLRIDPARIDAGADTPTSSGEEACPVIRANKILFASTAGRTRIVYF